MTRDVQARIHGIQGGLRCLPLHALPCLQVPDFSHLGFENFPVRNLVDVTHTEDEAKALAEEDQVRSSEFIQLVGNLNVSPSIHPVPGRPCRRR